MQHVILLRSPVRLATVAIRTYGTPGQPTVSSSLRPIRRIGLQTDIDPFPYGQKTQTCGWRIVTGEPILPVVPNENSVRPAQMPFAEAKRKALAERGAV